MDKDKESTARVAATQDLGAEPAADGGGRGAPDLPADLSAAYEKLLAEKQDLFDRLLRKQAEMDNFRKRTEREKEEFLKHAATDLIRALLPALDSFERALKHRTPDVPSQFIEGMELIHREILDVLGRAGLTPIKAEGQLFDPHLHQAVERVEAPEHRDQEIVEELQRGYKLKQRLLRPAIVKVAVHARDSEKGE
ncbi:MAG TPA: nucleotide exchange factor GrpE [Terriglobia bacterium]|nr:nucleotide exchange factor GrpE [Terriglobia bacterium]